MRERHVFEQLTPYEVAQLAVETLSDEHTLAIVFGREEWGLSSAEIAMCQRTASIPTSPEETVSSGFFFAPMIAFSEG